MNWKMNYFVVLLITFIGMNHLNAQTVDEFAKQYEKVTKYIPVLAYGQNNLNKLVYYRMGWNSKKPASVAIQFSNLGYTDWKLKFAVKDVTSDKMLLLDKEHNSTFGTELLKANSKGLIWSQPVDNINDKFSLRIWIGDDDEVDKDPISIKDSIKSKK